MRISEDRSRALLADLINLDTDLLQLAKRHRLRPSDLARWFDGPGRRETLAALSRMADMQTQWLLTRYRSFAVQELGALMQGKSESENPELLRRVCVDLLRLNMPAAFDKGDSIDGLASDADIQSLLQLARENLELEGEGKK